MKRSTLLSIMLALGILLQLMAASKGAAQASTWDPAWLDLRDQGTIHVLGQESGPASKPSSSQTLDGSPAATASGQKGFIDRLFSSLLPDEQTPGVTTAGWETIFSDDFEGTFPGDWNVFDNDGATNGEYYWAKKDCEAYEGSNSAWAVGGGADGSSLSCGSNYPDDAKSWMIYGPFSLADASDAEVRLMYRLNSELSYDLFFVGASIDGSQFYGATTSGVNDWTERVFDLTNVYTLGDLTGEEQVWIVIAFQSDLNTNSPEGVYVDNVLIEKSVEDGDTPTATSTSDPSATVSPTSQPPTSTPTATLTPEPDSLGVYLPWIGKLFPFIPKAPVIAAIDNSDGDGNYTVSWSTSEGATTYTLQEDDAEDFPSPTEVYSGSGTSKAISGRAIGTYYYRVRAANAGATSVWSKAASVKVTVPPPACPQLGVWSGTNSQGRNISFTVENTTRCQIAANTLRITIRDSCYATGTTTFTTSIAITNNHFSAGSASYGTQVVGDFTSGTTSSGTFSVSMPNPFPPPVFCTAIGTWNATAAP